MSEAASALPLRRPGVSSGLIDVFRWRFLLKLLVRKELRVRYHGSVLGLLWSYVKPAVQLVVFYVALGKFLGLAHAMPNYVIYLFSGIVIVNFFTEVFGNATRSIVRNADLVKKIFMPRELFPVASVWVAFIHLVPQLLVLGIASLIAGWRPSLIGVVSIVGALALTMIIGLGLGMAFGAVNVLFRDSENFVDLIVMMATWVSPVLYTWPKVQANVPDWAFSLYQLNPVTVCVELAHVGFWEQTAAVRDTGSHVPPQFGLWIVLGVVTTALVLAWGQWVFRRLERRFAQEI